MCGLTDDCVSEFVGSFRELPLVKDVVPAGSAKIVEAMCPLLGLEPSELFLAIQEKGGLLDLLPLLLETIGELVGVSDVCEARFVNTRSAIVNCSSTP